MTPRQLDASILGALLVISVLLFLPVIGGTETFFLRDLGTTQIPASMIVSEIGPALSNPHASFGQPLRWNPNLLALYPWPKGLHAANLQLLAHALMAFAGMFLFLRNVTEDRAAALFGATTFFLSGFVLSSMSFLNTTTVIAWLTMTLWLSDEWARGRSTTLMFAMAAAAALLSSLGGEPVVALVGLLSLSAVLLMVHRRWIVLAPMVTGLLLSLPYWILVFHAARGSSRVVHGFAPDDAFGNAFHPLRLLEILSPRLFGDWAAITGAWWGFTATGDQPPYLATTTIALSACFLTALAFRIRGVARILATAALSASAVAMIFTLGRFLPIESVPIRYPVKLHLATTLLVTIAASVAASELRRRSAFPSVRCLVVFGAVISAALLAIGAFGSALFSGFWDGAWRTPVVELNSYIDRAQPTAWWNLLAAILSLLALRVKNERLAVAALFAPLLLSALIFRGLVPTTSAASVRSPFLDHDIVTRHRVFERAGKDLDPVRRGLYGRYTADDRATLAAVQSQQLWALWGARHGVRYAFDRDPDGSYDDRMARLTRHLDLLSWDVREAWLRQSGVGSVISYMRLPENYRPIAIARESGVPAALYEVRAPLSEVRRVHCARSAGSFEDALDSFGRSIADDEIVIEGGTTFCNAGRGASRIVSTTPDSMTVDTEGSSPGWLFIARSWNGGARATVNAQDVQVLPANGAFLAVPLPAGKSLVRMKFR